MQQLLLFIYNNRAFFTFVALQLIAAWLIVNSNTYQGFAFLSSSNRVIGGVNNATGNVVDYFDLQKTNERLMRENALLRQQTSNATTRNLATRDTYRFIPGEVVNNTIRFNNNYLTINKGLADGVTPGMGVISDEGIVGKVKACSEHFSTVYSLLHSDIQVSSELKKDGSICSTKWGAEDYTVANLLFLARHKKINQGDTVVTSGSNAVFPPNIMIGTVKEVNKDESASFLDVKINLATEFSQLDYVYVIKNKYAAERDSLESTTMNDLTK
ncbi:MAG: rod shape-determining protein MreC [Flammeovirgaceae bacterium]